MKCRACQKEINSGVGALDNRAMAPLCYECWSGQTHKEMMEAKIIKLPERKEDERVSIHIDFDQARPIGPRVKLGVALMITAAALMGIKYEVKRG